MYKLLGRLDDNISWEQIGHATAELASAKADADKYVEYYALVEVRDQGTGRVVYRATRPPMVLDAVQGGHALRTRPVPGAAPVPVLVLRSARHPGYPSGEAGEG